MGLVSVKISINGSKRLLPHLKTNYFNCVWKVVALDKNLQHISFEQSYVYQYYCATKSVFFFLEQEIHFKVLPLDCTTYIVNGVWP